MLDNDGFTTPSDVEQKFTEADWQKYKLTSEKGESISVDLENNIDNLDKLEPGFYYITNTPGVPYAKSFAGTALVIKRDKNSVKQVIFFPFTTNSVYINSYYNNWSGWQQVGGTIKDTGWLDLQLVNNASPNNDLVTKGGFTSAYRTITQNGITKKMLRINATTIKHGQTIAMLPKGFVNNLVFFNISTPRSKYLGRIALNPSGLVDFSAVGDVSTWGETDYIYGQYEWTE